MYHTRRKETVEFISRDVLRKTLQAQPILLRHLRKRVKQSPFLFLGSEVDVTAERRELVLLLCAHLRDFSTNSRQGVL